MNGFVENVQRILEEELEAKQADIEHALLFADGYDAKMAVLEEKVFIDTVAVNVEGLVAELEAQDAEIDMLRKHLADYHQKHCPLVTGEGDECACESAPPLLNISDFEPLEAVLVSPVAAPAP